MNDLATRPPRASSQITELLVGQTRVETKIDHLLDTVAGTTKRVEGLEETADDHSTRLIKLESFNGFVLWVVGAAFAILVALLGAGTWWLGNG